MAETVRPGAYVKADSIAKITVDVRQGAPHSNRGDLVGLLRVEVEHSASNERRTAVTRVHLTLHAERACARPVRRPMRVGCFENPRVTTVSDATDLP